MADTKLTDLTALTAPALADQVYIVDTSDTTDDAAGSSRRILLSDLIKAIGGKIPLQTIALATAGEFDFSSIPSGYKRLVIAGTIRGSVTAANDNVRIYFNAEDAADVGNYHEQPAGAINGANLAAEAAGSSRIAYMPAGSSPSDRYAAVRIVVEDYAGTGIKMALSDIMSPYDASASLVGKFGVTSSTTAAVTRIRIQADGHPTDGMIGELTLYGEL